MYAALYIALCMLQGCKTRACFVSWLEVVKGILNQGVDCFVSYGSFFCFSFVFRVYVVFCFLVFGCPCQCNQMPGKTRLRNHLLCVEWDVKSYRYSVTHHNIYLVPDTVSVYLATIGNITSYASRAFNASITTPSNADVATRR